MNEHIAACRRYADTEPSDPFSFNRAMTHLANGIASYRQADGEGGRKAGEPAFYDATERSERRQYQGHGRGAHPGKTGEYFVRTHRNVTRP